MIFIPVLLARLHAVERQVGSRIYLDNLRIDVARNRYKVTSQADRTVLEVTEIVGILSYILPYINKYPYICSAI
jgi:hypothetical protein